jgi:hypothetical protein
MFDSLTTEERHQLRLMITRGAVRACNHPEVLWRYGVIDDCYEILRWL